MSSSRAVYCGLRTFVAEMMGPASRRVNRIGG
jgi:hypothetical protein